MWEISKQHKKDILSHFSDVLVCGALFAASLLSFRYRDLLWGPWVGSVASVLLIVASLWSFALNVKEAEDVVKSRYPGLGRWWFALIGIVYMIPMTQLFLAVGLAANT